MTEIINWVRDRSEIYIVHNSAFKPNNFYFNNLQAATDFFNNLILFIGVHHSSDENTMGSLYRPQKNSDFSTLSIHHAKHYRGDWESIKFYTGDFAKESQNMLFKGTLIPPYTDVSIKPPGYRDYTGIWKSRSYPPEQIKKTAAHRFNHQASQISFIKGWWLETINGTYEISLGKINIDE